MTSTYYKKIFDYDFWANERMLAAMEATPSLAEEAVKKMSHLLLAKSLWMSRLMPGISTPDLSGLLTPTQGNQLNKEHKSKLEDYFSKFTDAQLSEKIAYKNTKGIPSEFVLSDILAHMVNHGTYHRGQVASLIKKSGGNPPETDYIVYVRQKG
jgi:uncharacterized damage-inducible protein DinB